MRCCLCCQFLRLARFTVAFDGGLECVQMKNGVLDDLVFFDCVEDAAPFDRVFWSLSGSPRFEKLSRVQDNRFFVFLSSSVQALMAS